MINEDFDEFIQAEARHKSVYLGSDQKIRTKGNKKG